mmetsp:Transcript_33320/g.89197  ORF Transcript_33320/g.89197 Transcript_33320/m.89197 type:complete len:212 (+) Transcript_33320:172-807(+)
MFLMPICNVTLDFGQPAHEPCSVRYTVPSDASKWCNSTSPPSCCTKGLIRSSMSSNNCASMLPSSYSTPPSFCNADFLAISMSISKNCAMTVSMFPFRASHSRFDLLLMVTCFAASRTSLTPCTLKRACARGESLVANLLLNSKLLYPGPRTIFPSGVNISESGLGVGWLVMDTLRMAGHRSVLEVARRPLALTRRVAILAERVQLLGPEA